MRRKIVEYTVVKYSCAEKMTDEINALLKDGWELYDGGNLIAYGIGSSRYGGGFGCMARELVKYAD